MIDSGCTRNLDLPSTPTIRPIAEIDLTRPLLALDVDGPLNRWDGNRKPAHVQGPETRFVRSMHGPSFRFDFYPKRIAELHRIVRTYGVNIGWLTTWGPNVAPMVEQAFDGLLAGGFILRKMPKKYRGEVPAHWKFAGLRDHLDEHRTPWAWVEDEAISEAGTERVNELIYRAPDGLLIEVDEQTMITEGQLVQLDAFFSKHTAQPPPTSSVWATPRTTRPGTTTAGTAAGSTQPMTPR